MIAQGLPIDVGVECLVLGCALMDPELMHQVRPVLTLEQLGLEKHRRIYRAAAKLYDAGLHVDKITVATALKDDGELEAVGGLSYLCEMTDGLPLVPDLSSYMAILRDDAARRQIMAFADSLMRRAADREPPQELLNSLVNLAIDSAPAEPKKGLVSASQLVERVGIDAILAPRITRGVAFPWEWLSNVTCGMLPGDLWILAAHTSAGKTSAAIQTAVGVARAQSKPVAFFSLEMGDVSIFQRAVWQLSRVDSERAKRGKLSPEERVRATAAVNTLRDLPLYFDDGSLSVMEIHARLRRLRSRGPIGLIVVDYLQLLRDGGRHNTRAEAVGTNARMLKLLASEFECPVLVLSQFNRDSAKSKGNESPRRPELHDLKESGDIENHANGVWFIHRPSAVDADQISVEFILPKQRDGRRNVLREFWFFPKYQRFDGKEDADGYHSPTQAKGTFCATCCVACCSAAVSTVAA